MDNLIPPINVDILLRELEGKLLCNTNKAHNNIYIVNSRNAPNVIKEIGRLRELSFRDSGGGSGKSLDLDKYDLLDKPFQQLIIWNPEKHEIIGGYRFLHGKNITLDNEGLPIMPMRHIFDFSDKYITDYLPYTIELGRAFIQPKYQSYKSSLKSIYALDNLWDGIGAIIGLYKDVKYVVGKVTIFPQMKIEARYAITYFLNKFYRDKNNLITPVKDEVVPKQYSTEFDQLFSKDTVGGNFKILQSYVKEKGEKMPPLIKAYVELAKEIKCFGTCFDKDFGNIYDTGIMINIDDIYKDKKERYLEYCKQKLVLIKAYINRNKASIFSYDKE